MPEATPTRDYVAVLDIGSNAVRLVVFDGMNRVPVKIHNERDLCGLGADLGKTGRLNADGVEHAMQSIGRFAALIEAMKIKHVMAVATAALRDAADGPDFIAAVQKKFGLTIRVIDGEEEARLSAIGVMMNGLGTRGIIGDFGGGSLELIQVNNHTVEQKQSLPIGSLRLQAAGSRDAQLALIETHLSKADFITAWTGGDFYVLGGSWRAMAKLHIRMTGHPLKVMDQYSMSGEKALAFARMIAAQSVEDLEKSSGLSKKRVQDMGPAALAMAAVLEKMQPARVIFSATGLREGAIYDALPPALQRQDALTASCRKVALKISRFHDVKSFTLMSEWMAPLFAMQHDSFTELLESACLLSDTGWFEHEDYQALHAFERILLLPLYGVDHTGRAFLALANYVRYGGTGDDEVADSARHILTRGSVTLAIVAGLGMRVAYLLTGGALSLLKDTELAVTEDQVILRLSGKSAGLHAAVIDDAMKDLAEMLGRACRVIAD
ncbi:MAG: Ppx/GppA phosphatase family protein [Bdellovibrionales bacterium]|jgi:exopolyphosphatase/guanosine-5'-triphosphate,3'-diphosphate pyrophosphatase|nr:Ppx/GppA phosphatase family protein [Bdellovibrionales bacterium]